MPNFVVPRIGVKGGAEMASVLGIADLVVIDVDASGRPIYRTAAMSDVSDSPPAPAANLLVDRDGLLLVDRDRVQLVER